MTQRNDWEFRAGFLRQQASYLRDRSEDFLKEANRYEGLAEQADMLARMAAPPDNKSLTESKG